MISDNDKNRTGGNNLFVLDDEEWVRVDISDCSCKPPVSDFEDSHRKGKKGKYLKDWE